MRECQPTTSFSGQPFWAGLVSLSSGPAGTWLWVAEELCLEGGISQERWGSRMSRLESKPRIALVWRRIPVLSTP